MGLMDDAANLQAERDEEAERNRLRKEADARPKAPDWARELASLLVTHDLAPVPVYQTNAWNRFRKPLPRINASVEVAVRTLEFVGFGWELSEYIPDSDSPRQTDLLLLTTGELQTDSIGGIGRMGTDWVRVISDGLYADTFGPHLAPNGAVVTDVDPAHFAGFLNIRQGPVRPPTEYDLERAYRDVAVPTATYVLAGAFVNGGIVRQAGTDPDDEPKDPEPLPNAVLAKALSGVHRKDRAAVEAELRLYYAVSGHFPHRWL